MAKDITNSIIDKMCDPNTGMLDLLNTGLISTNPIFLKTISRPPLQDDPTRRSYYLVIGPEKPTGDDDYFRMPITSVRRGKMGMGTELPQHEMDGSMVFVNFFTIEGWTPRANTREACYEQGMEALSRVELALFRLQHSEFFFGIETDDGRESTGNLYQAFGYDGGRMKTMGGDAEWYGQLKLRFHVYSKVKRAWFMGEEF